MHSIVIYSYHDKEDTIETVSNFIHHLNISELSPWESIADSLSLMGDINSAKLDYVMFSADTDVLENPDEVMNPLIQHKTIIRDTIKNNVGKNT